MFKAPDNEWLRGMYYKYNPEQDQNRPEIKRKITNGTFEKDEDYDDKGYSEIPITFRYKRFTKNQTRGEYSENAKNHVTNTSIQTTDNTIDFKNDDKIMLQEQKDAETPKIIVDVSRNFNTYQAVATFSFPGFAEEYANGWVITLA